MQIIVSGQHLAKFPEMESYASKKVAKLAKYHPGIIKAEVHLIAEQSHRGQEEDYYCEIAIDLPGQDLEIVDSQRSMDKAIDKAIERMKRLLVKTKEKKVTKKHREGLFRKLLNRF